VKQPYLYLIFGLILTSCIKQELSIDLTESDKFIKAEGTISDSLQTQYFEFNWSSDLEDETPDFIDDMSFQVVTDDSIYNYVHDFDGRYKSTVPFKGIAGETYSFEFSRAGESYSALTVMPSPFTIDSLYLDLTGGNTSNSFDRIRIQLDSESEQYFGYDLYAFQSFNGVDTVWDEILTPVYWVTPVLAAPNQIIKPPTVNFGQSFENFQTIKMEIYSLSTDVGEYLLELQTYMNSGQANSQFYNPPSFFSNKAYGMAYGVSKKTVIFSP